MDKRRKEKKRKKKILKGFQDEINKTTTLIKRIDKGNSGAMIGIEDLRRICDRN